MSNRLPPLASNDGPRTLTRHEAARLVRQAAAAFLSGEIHPAIRNHGRTIDDHARAVLRRLSEDGRNSDPITAAEAICAVAPSTAWNVIFADCIVAEYRARHHKQGISDSRGVFERAEKAKKALRTVEDFLKLPEPDPGREEDPVQSALALVAQALAMKQRLAQDRIRLSSRKHDDDAARAEGVGWIRDGLKRTCRLTGGKTEPRYVAAIATAALNMGEVTPDAARKAPSFEERFRRS